ncbi:hypothetical protein B0J12DRAFT_686213 [Macrophomina phaseolina]|uniref:Uncharacterized protein n=1 Tax=Macrophomina phaseolina TaxID=35725 RepID=A0ABQ8FTF3_9PEZI|nr:hypothetical protein B0J12DRAFT_686213 [Macrophomina phaseolina]
MPCSCASLTCLTTPETISRTHEIKDTSTNHRRDMRQIVSPRLGLRRRCGKEDARHLHECLSCLDGRRRESWRLSERRLTTAGAHDGPAPVKVNSPEAARLRALRTLLASLLHHRWLWQPGGLRAQSSSQAALSLPAPPSGLVVELLLTPPVSPRRARSPGTAAGHAAIGGHAHVFVPRCRAVDGPLSYAANWEQPDCGAASARTRCARACTAPAPGRPHFIECCLLTSSWVSRACV